ncbi:MAG: drug/metabolite transporter (DMT)-like permease [Acidimicrobiales bacterium]
MPLWIPVTLAAATFQILRTARQHQVRDVLSLAAAGYVRFAYGLPFAVVALLGTALVRGELPRPGGDFWPFVLGGGTAQILGTVALLKAFELRDFAIGNVFSKTEVVQVALISALLLGEPLRPLGWVGVVVCMVGVVWLATPSGLRSVMSGIADPAAGMGALAGGLFAVSAVCIRGAASTMDGAAWPRAIVTLTVMLAFQTVLNGVILSAIEPQSPRAVIAAWRSAWIVGLFSLCGSAGWALAMTLTNAAKVRTLGQIEIVLAFVISVVWLKERHTPHEYAASALVVAGIASVIMLG